MKKLMTVLTISTGFVLAGLTGAAFADTVATTDPLAVIPDPTSYVTVDAGTGFELTLNADNEVITVEAVDAAGDAVVDGIDLTGQPVEEAIGELIDEAIAEGVLPTDGTVPVDVTVVTEDGTTDGTVDGTTDSTTDGTTDGTADGTDTGVEEDALADAIEDAIADATEELDVPVVITYQNAALERVAMAKALGITPGKLNLIQKYAATTESPEGVVVADWTEKSVKEIMAAIKANRKAAVEPEGDADVPEAVEEPEETEAPDADVSEAVDTPEADTPDTVTSASDSDDEKSSPSEGKKNNDKPRKDGGGKNKHGKK